jgi:putative transposase
MPKNRVHLDVNHRTYFITLTIWNWYYIFDRHDRWRIIADSLKHCQENKGVQIYAYVFMLNHLHLIISAPDVTGFLRDFKKFTSKKLIENLRETEPEVLELFKTEDGYRFWKEDNQPKIIETEKFGLQKVNYIHNNPVVKGYVDRSQYWKWSSANPESEIKIVEF